MYNCFRYWLCIVQVRVKFSCCCLMSLALQREAKQQQLCDEMHIGLKQVFRYCPYSSGHQQKNKNKNTQKNMNKNITQKGKTQITLCTLL